jgi:hypothetical protein
MRQADRVGPPRPWSAGAGAAPVRLAARRVARLVCAALALSLAAGAGGASAQVAETDPASDVLFLRDVYYPFNPPVPRDQQQQLDTVVRQLRDQGVPMKVALISGSSDLGSAIDYLGKPGAYNAYLTRNLDDGRDKIVVTVMHDGIAESGATEAQARALASVRPPKAGGGEALTRAALLAVTRLAEAGGQTVRVPTRATSGDDLGSGGGSGAAWLAFAPLLVGIALAAVLIVKRRLGGGGRSAT